MATVCTTSAGSPATKTSTGPNSLVTRRFIQPRLHLGAFAEIGGGIDARGSTCAGRYRRTSPRRRTVARESLERCLEGDPVGAGT